MAHIAGGTFLGYRELARAAPLGRRGWSFAPPPPPLRLKPWEYDLLGPVPFEYKIFKGWATDNYAVDFQEIDLSYGTPRLIFCTIREHAAKFTFTYDGTTSSREREFSIGFARLEGVVAFKVKNATPGLTSWYQLCFMF